MRGYSRCSCSDKVTMEFGPHPILRRYSASMRRCFHCGAKAEATHLTKVGDGEFCERCFLALLQGENTSEAPAPGAPLGDAPTSRSASATSEAFARRAAPSRTNRHASSPSALRCLVCSRELSQQNAVPFLGGSLCPECNGEMIEELRRAPSSRPSASAPSSRPSASAPSSRPSAERSASERSASERSASGLHGAAPALDEAEVALATRVDEGATTSFTPGGETRWCAGCERPMPGPGSYRVLQGKPYCAACVPFYAERRQPTVQRTENEGAASAAVCHEGTLECDCCGRQLPEPPEPCEGFSLCGACLATDTELALSVAKLRHRRRLAELGSQYDSEKGK
jgi:hypothetical protein